MRSCCPSLSSSPVTFHLNHTNFIVCYGILKAQSNPYCLHFITDYWSGSSQIGLGVDVGAEALLRNGYGVVGRWVGPLGRRDLLSRPGGLAWAFSCSKKWRSRAKGCPCPHACMPSCAHPRRFTAGAQATLFGVGLTVGYEYRAFSDARNGWAISTESRLHWGGTTRTSAVRLV